MSAPQEEQIMQNVNHNNDGPRGQDERGAQQNGAQENRLVQTPQAAAAFHDIDTHIKVNCKTVAPVIIPMVLAFVALNIGHIVTVAYSGSQAATQAQVKSTYPQIYRNCKDAFDQGQTHSGIYRIKPDRLPAFDVYCDMDTDGGGWVVFQRRMDGTVDFYRNWADYVKGFGDLNGEFWLGLGKIHRLTCGTGPKGIDMLRVDLEDFEETTKHAIYNSFKILDSSQGYVLKVSDYSKYGTVGDSLTYHSGMKFTTADNNNVKQADHNCAHRYRGGWWYQDCHEANLNGPHNSGKGKDPGVSWKKWFRNGERGLAYSLKTTEMKLHPN